MCARRIVAFAVAGAAVTTFSACTDLPDAADDRVPEATLATEDPAVSPVPLDTSPFCAAMLELARSDDELSLADLLDAYEQIHPDVPAAVLAEFEAVLGRLRLLAAGEESPMPDVADEAARTLSAYVDDNCRGTVRTPLPPPTAPDAPAAGDDG